MSTSESNFQIQANSLFVPTSFTPTTGTLVTVAIGAKSGIESVIGGFKVMTASITFGSTSDTEAVGSFIFTFPTTTPFTSAPSLSLTIGTSGDNAVEWKVFASAVSTTTATIILRQTGTESTPAGLLSIVATGPV